jgi:hypothetical protein
MRVSKQWIRPVVYAIVLNLLGTHVLAQKAAEIPPGTAIKVRMIDSLSSARNQAGDTFHGTLEQAVVADAKEIYPKGADVTGRIAQAKPSGRLSEPGELSLVLATIASGNHASSVESEPLLIKGESHTKSNATKIGGGAALGAVIGAIAGGGKGAAIGTVAGAGAGTGAAAATGKREAIVESEAVLSFVAAAPTSASGSASPNAPAEEKASPENANPAAKKENPTSPPETEAVPATGAQPEVFSARDRRVIRNCVSEHSSELPSGTVQREELPSGTERQLRRGSLLPAEIQRRAQALPLACEQQLPPLPASLERVVYDGRVLLINDESGRVVDTFDLQAEP